MALKYFLYDTDYSNTIIDSSTTSFAPIDPYEEIYIDFLIPETQPYYLYANSGGTGGTIIINTQENIDDYLVSIEQPPTPYDYVDYNAFTGETQQLESQIDGKVNITDFNNYTGTTLPNTYLDKTTFATYSGDTEILIGTKLDTDDFNSYTGDTQTLIGGKLNTSDFNTYTGDTETIIGQKLDTSDFNTYTGDTQTLIGTKLDSDDFNTYSGTTGLQQVTDINAITTNETTFSGGVVLEKVRPTGDTITAIQFTKADGSTPVINIDTFSGYTGFGTTAPQGLVHAYGTNSDGGIVSNYTQPNAFIIDGSSDVDKDINWSENGVPKWLADTYRNEKSKFWYLYNVGADNVALAVSETGRIGVNKVPNTMNSHAGFIGEGLDDIVIGGVYTDNYNSAYELKIDSVSGVTDTFIWRFSVDGGNTFSSWSTSSAVTTTELPFINGITIKFGSTTGHTINDGWFFGGFTQLPEASLTVAPMSISDVLVTDNYTANPIVYTNITSAVNGGGVLGIFNILNTGTTGTDNAFYWGSGIELDSLFFTFVVLGEGITLVIEYWNGISWIGIDYFNNNLVDNTNNLTQNGQISWKPSTFIGWTSSTIPDYVGERYWMRLRTSSNPTITPIGRNVSIGNDKRFSVYSAHNDYLPSFYVDALGRTSIGGRNITGCNLLQVGSVNSVNESDFQSQVQFDSSDSSSAALRLRLSYEGEKGYCIGFAKNRGTASNPEPVQNGDNIGNILWGAPVGSVSTGVLLGDISTEYTGDGTTKYGDIIFKTHDDDVSPLPKEVMRITGSGNTGFGGIEVPTAKIHITGGTTSVAPLKFTTGDLLSSAQEGAVEFDGSQWYGTVTGDTRKTFAFLESPVFTGAPALPSGTTINDKSLPECILISGGTDNPNLVQVTDFNTYTGNTDTIITGIEDNITYLSGQTDTKLPTTTFNTYTGTTQPWSHISKVGSSIADLETRNGSDVNYINTDWDITDVADGLDEITNYLENTQGSGRLTPENVLAGRLTNTLVINGGSGYITYEGFHRNISWSGQTIDVTGYAEGTYYVSIDSNGDTQISTSTPDVLTNISLGFFYYGGNVIGVVQQCGCVIKSALSRIMEYTMRQGSFIYDNGGRVNVMSGNTLKIVSSPCKVQYGLTTTQLTEISSDNASTFQFTHFYNTANVTWESGYYFSLANQGKIYTGRWNDITKNDKIPLSGYTLVFTQGSNIVTSTSDLTSLVTDDNFISLSGDSDVYSTPVSAVTWTGSQTNIVLETPYLGAGGTGVGTLNYSLPKLPIGTYAKHLIVRAGDDSMNFILAQTYYNTEGEAIEGSYPALPPSLIESAIKMAGIVTTLGQTDLTGNIYDIRPLPYSYREGGQAGGGTAITNHGDLSGLGNDDHLQYLRSDGTRNISGIQRYQSQPTFTTDLDVITKKYSDDQDNLRLSSSVFDTFTGTTAPAIYLGITNFNNYSGTTLTNIDSRLLTSNFNTYSGNTAILIGGKEPTIAAGTTLQYWRGDKSFQTLNTSVVPELTNLYFTNTRAQSAITGGASSITTANLTASRALVSDASGKVGVSTVTSTQLGYVAGVTSAIQTQLNAKANLASPTFTGVPLSTTAIVNTSTTQIATTAYVVGQAANVNPLMDDGVSIGSSLRYARQDHIHPSDTSRVAKTGDTMTGSLKINQSLYVTGTTATPTELQNAVLLGAITTDGRIIATNTPALNVSESVTDITISTLITEISGIYYVDTTSGNITLTIPNAATINDAKKMVILKKAGTNNVIITTVGGTQNIGNATSQIITQIDKGITVVADTDNNKWIIIQDSRYVEGLTEGELQYWNNTTKNWKATSNDITWNNTGKVFTVGGNSTPSTFKVDGINDIVYINAPTVTGLVAADDLGFYAGGRGAFGNSVTIDRLRASAAGNVPRSLSLIDDNAVMRVWRYTDGTGDPSVEFIWGTGALPTTVGNAWWDMYLDGAVSPNDTFAIRRRTEGVDANKLTISTTVVNVPITTTSTTPTTGALTIAGGVGINQNLNINGITKLGNVTPDVNQQNFSVIDNTTKKLANSGTKFHVYGSEFQLVESNGSSTSTATTPQTKVSMTTTNLPAGKYKIFAKWRFSHTSASNSARFDLTLNGTAIGTRTPMSVEPKDTTNITSLTAATYEDMSGVNTIILQYWNEGSSTTISDASIELIRVS